MHMSITSAQVLQYSLVVAYGAIITDILLQIRRILEKQRSDEISIVGTIVRAAATFVFLAKYVSLHDQFLIVGQSVFLCLLAMYIFLLSRYRLVTNSTSNPEHL